jgi:hypothetical protein
MFIQSFTDTDQLIQKLLKEGDKQAFYLKKFFWPHFLLFCVSEETPNVTVKWLTLRLCTQEDSDSKLSLGTSYLTDFICSFTQSLQANTRIVPQN